MGTQGSFFTNNSTIYVDTNPAGPADAPLPTNNTASPSSFFKGTGGIFPQEVVTGIQAFVPIAHQWLTGVATSGVFSSTQPSFTDISGVVANAQIPAPTLSALGGVEAINAVSHQWINSISTAGVPALSQPAFTDISGSLDGTQTPAYTGDVTKPAGSTVTTLANIPNLTPAPGAILFSNTATPTVPAAGTSKVWYDNVNLVLSAKNASNVISNTVVPSTAAAHQFATAISTHGIVTWTQPAFTDVSGTIATAQVSGAYTGITQVGTLTAGAIGTGFTAIPNSALANSAVTISGHALSLGGTLSLASGDISGLGTFATQNYATPPVIGGTTPADVHAAALSSTGAVTVGTHIFMPTSTVGIFIGNPAASNSPHVDFKSSGLTTNYDSRLIASGGSATDGTGVLTLVGTLGVTPIPTTTQQAINTLQSGPTSGSLSTVDVNYNLITISADQANINTSLGNSVQGLLIDHTYGGTNLNGARYSFAVNSRFQFSSTSNTSKNYTALAGHIFGEANDGGTNTGAGSAGGLFAGNLVFTTNNLATNFGNFCGLEIDMAAVAGSSTRLHMGVNVAKFTGNIIGASLDAAYVVSGNGGGRWSNGLTFSDVSGVFGVATTGTLLSVVSVGNQATPYTVAYDIDFSLTSPSVASWKGNFSSDGDITWAGTAWTAFTPTLTAAAGTLTTTSIIFADYKKLGKVVVARYRLRYTTVGTGATAVIVTLPVTATSSATGSLYNVQTNKAGTAIVGYDSATTLRGYLYDGTFPVADGQDLFITVTYEAA